MSTSANEGTASARRLVRIYTFITMFCRVFFLVYDQFSHGVRSPYMTWLFLLPFTLGVLPETLLWKLPKLPIPGTLSANLYHSGVAALTVSSLLRGIFEIAGNASIYQEWLMAAGWCMVLGGAIVYLGRMKTRRE